MAFKLKNFPEKKSHTSETGYAGKDNFERYQNK